MWDSFAWPDREEDEAPQRVFGDYVLLEEIARGGMGVVYKARQASLNRIVALKMILRGSHAEEKLIQRFGEEANAAAALQHSNIVAIHEVGIHRNRHFYSMDYVEGTNLSERIRGGPLRPAQAAQCLKVVAEAVHYAHEQGVLHRDLKPANILIDLEGQPHVTDFGLAKRFTTDHATNWLLLGPELTASSETVGSPSFMAPEQASHHLGPLGRYTDVYALGAILYALLTGQPPFRGDTPVATLRMVLDEEPVPPRLRCPVVPVALEAIALKCLEKIPGRRYATARELAEDLDRFLTGHPVRARREWVTRPVCPTVEPHPRRAPTNESIPPNRLELRNAAIAALALSNTGADGSAEPASGPVFFETTLKSDTAEDRLDRATRAWIRRLLEAIRQARATTPDGGPPSPHLREVHAGSVDGRLLARARVAGAIGVIQRSSQTEVAELQLPGSAAVSKLAFLDDDRALVAVGDREEVFIWDLVEMRRRLARIDLDWRSSSIEDELSSNSGSSVVKK